MNNLWCQSACEAVELLKSGTVTSHDLLDSLEQRIKEVNSDINALPTLCFDRAHAHVERIGQRNLQAPLYGLPVVIKDGIPVEGVRTTYGSKLFEDHVPVKSDQLVTRIENNGGVVYAKSNLPEFGTGGVTFNDVFGVTRTPYNTENTSGGSSGGAAASLAAGCSWLSHGSDLAGSLRTPAAFCGVTSLRPSPGRIRSDSEYLPYSVLGAEGPMARDIMDLGLFASAIFCGAAESLALSARSPVSPLRVAVSPDLGIAKVDDDVRAVFDSFVRGISSAGIETVDACPGFDGLEDAFDALRGHEYAIGLEQTLERHPGVMKPEVEWNIGKGVGLSSQEIRQAKRTQGKIINEAVLFMQDVDLLICPATSVSGVSAELRYPGSNGAVPIPEYYRWLSIAYAITMTSLPVITMPCGGAVNGMPIGVQLVGKLWGEEKLLQHAKSIEQLVGWNSDPINPVCI